MLSSQHRICRLCSREKVKDGEGLPSVYAEGMWNEIMLLRFNGISKCPPRQTAHPKNDSECARTFWDTHIRHVSKSDSLIKGVSTAMHLNDPYLSSYICLWHHFTPTAGLGEFTSGRRWRSCPYIKDVLRPPYPRVTNWPPLRRSSPYPRSGCQLQPPNLWPSSHIFQPPSFLFRLALNTATLRADAVPLPAPPPPVSLDLSGPSSHFPLPVPVHWARI